jgi:peptide/nickel transport system permease protein
MRRYIARRLLLIVPVLLMITLAVALLMRLVPGDPATLALGQAATPADRQAFRHAYHLDESIPVQYVHWWQGVLEGNLGSSVVHRTTVTAELRTRLPSTLELLVLGVIFTTIIGVPAGVISAVKQNSPLDVTARLLSICGQSVPNFWLGTLALIMPAIWWNYLPPITKVSLTTHPLQNLQQYALPAFVLAVGSASGIMRLTRSAVLDVLGNDYVRTARAKGLSGGVVVMRHVLKNSMIPVITVLGLQVAALFGGAVILETIFNLQGIGLLFIDSIGTRDYPVIQGLVFFLAVMFLLVNLVVDLSYAWFDPRIRYG